MVLVAEIYVVPREKSFEWDISLTAASNPEFNQFAHSSLMAQYST